MLSGTVLAIKHAYFAYFFIRYNMVDVSEFNKAQFVEHFTSFVRVIYVANVHLFIQSGASDVIMFRNGVYSTFPIPLDILLFNVLICYCYVVVGSIRCEQHCYGIQLKRVFFLAEQPNA